MTPTTSSSKPAEEASTSTLSRQISMADLQPIDDILDRINENKSHLKLGPHTILDYDSLESTRFILICLLGKSQCAFCVINHNPRPASTTIDAAP
jgi:hypothetical protein